MKLYKFYDPIKRVCLSIFCLTLMAVGIAAQNQPIRMHPDNPHYFEYRGEPTVLITSAEHYGAVLNLDFDYKTEFIKK